MPRSDKTRQALNKRFIQYQRPEAPAMGPMPKNKGKTPNLNHAKNLPVPDNTRPPHKSSCIFDK